MNRRVVDGGNGLGRLLRPNTAAKQRVQGVEQDILRLPAKSIERKRYTCCRVTGSGGAQVFRFNGGRIGGGYIEIAAERCTGRTERAVFNDRMSRAKHRVGCDHRVYRKRHACAISAATRGGNS
ncbi:hypothetical protein LP7551_04490 [Roseibium album]|nr:hypothetical protein LP7551_04490 [Roseibium album]